jgi:uncharacterized membrane protein
MQENNYWQRDWKAIISIIAVIAGVFSIVLYMKKRNHKVIKTERVVSIEKKRLP